MGRSPAPGNDRIAARGRGHGSAGFGAGVMRSVGFFALWIVLMPSAQPADLVCGVVATLLATWTSLRLQPPEQGHLRFVALLGLVPHFLWQSLLAGCDVARRAFHPRMPMDPGLVECPLDFPPGMTLNTFATITSLLPGSVPCGYKPGVLVYHCLDRGLPNVEQLQKEARLFAKALVAGRGQDHD